MKYLFDCLDARVFKNRHRMIYGFMALRVLVSIWGLGTLTRARFS